MKIPVLLIVAALFSLLPHPSRGASEDGDALFSKGRWREALGAYQISVRNECIDQKRTNLDANLFFSNLNETDSDVLLKAHSLFERGVLAYLKGDKLAASKEWILCRDALQVIPKSENRYLRRVNMALALLWVQSIDTKDQRYFVEGLAEICKTIDEAPLPENSSNFREQIQSEYWLLAANELLHAFGAINAAGPDDAKGRSILSHTASELWSKRALANLITRESETDGKSHEALVDKALFGNGRNEVAANLYKKLIAIGQQMPPSGYANSVALLAVYGAETGIPQVVSSLMKENVAPQKINRLQFGNAIYTLLTISQSFPAANREAFIEGVTKRLDLLEWPNPSIAIETAVSIARAGSAPEALTVLRAHQVAAESSLFPLQCAAFTEVLYRAGDFEKSAGAAAPLIEKGIPDNLAVDVFYWRGRAYAKLQKIDKAIKSLEIFLEKSPGAQEAPEATFFIATLYLAQGKRPEAQKAFQQTIDSYPGTRYGEQAGVFLSTMTR